MNLSSGSRVLLCCFLAIVNDTYGQMKPSNAVAEVGGKAFFNCSGSAFLPNWFMSKDGTITNQLPIAGSCNVNNNLQNHYKTEQIGGANNCNLVVFDVTMEQAGTYWCTESVTSYALLTVINKSPATTQNFTQGVVVENENVIMTCTLHHNGSVTPAPALRPYFYWTDSNGQNTSSSYDSTTEKTAVSQITVIAGRQNITGYTCHVYLKLNATTVPNYANNTPTVSNSITTTPIDVLYGPSLPNITSGFQIITIDGIACEVSIVTCTSSGNPSPVYEWFDTLENVSLIKSSNFDLAEINRTYTCVASNTIRNEKISSITFHVPKKGSTTKTCRFPHHESTWINVTDSDNGTGDCSNGYDGLNFTCNANTYPNASYQWTGADNSQVNSQIYKNITINGIYSCTAYFKQSTSNYTGNVIFTNGTSEENVTECCSEWILIVSVIIPWVGECLIVTIIFIVCYATLATPFRAKMLSRFPWLDYMLPCIKKPGEAQRVAEIAEKTPALKRKIVFVVLLIIVSVTCGIVFFPILITIAYFSPKIKVGDGEYANSGEVKGKPAYLIPLIILMWIGVVVFMFPFAFVIVYFVHCEQMTFRYVVTP